MKCKLIHKSVQISALEILIDPKTQTTHSYNMSKEGGQISTLKISCRKRRLSTSKPCSKSGKVARSQNERLKRVRLKGLINYEYFLEFKNHTTSVHLPCTRSDPILGQHAERIPKQKKLAFSQTKRLTSNISFVNHRSKYVFGFRFGSIGCLHSDGGARPYFLGSGQSTHSMLGRSVKYNINN